VAPVTIDVSLSPNTVTAGTQVIITGHLHDGGNHDIGNQTMIFTSSNRAVANFVRYSSWVTSSDGKASVTLDTYDTNAGTVDVEITASSGQFLGTASLRVVTSDPPPQVAAQ
jgi:hypothetical protein